jgi:hypothetical protein
MRRGNTTNTTLAGRRKGNDSGGIFVVVVWASINSKGYLFAADSIQKNASTIAA